MFLPPKLAIFLGEGPFPRIEGPLSKNWGPILWEETERCCCCGWWYQLSFNTGPHLIEGPFQKLRSPGCEPLSLLIQQSDSSEYWEGVSVHLCCIAKQPGVSLEMIYHSNKVLFDWPKRCFVCCRTESGYCLTVGIIIHNRKELVAHRYVKSSCRSS